MKLEQTIPTGDESILFVDDEKPIVDMATEILALLGYNVTACLSPKEGLDLFQKNPNHFDLAITDLTMPGMTGTELSVELLKIKPCLPIILCSGYGNLINTKTINNIGISKFILKPVTVKTFAYSIREVLD